MADWPYNTAAWSRLRRAKLDANPACEPCEAAGRVRIANTVDHVVPVSAGGSAFPPLDGLTSMCPPCHGAKTARGVEAGAIRSTKPRKGCDADGNPLDPAHPWRAGKSLRADGTGPTPGSNPQLISARGRSALSVRSGCVDPPKQSIEVDIRFVEGCPVYPCKSKVWDGRRLVPAGGPVLVAHGGNSINALEQNQTISEPYRAIASTAETKNDG